MNLQPSLGTDGGVVVTVIEDVTAVAVALALLEPKLFYNETNIRTKISHVVVYI